MVNLYRSLGHLSSYKYFDKLLKFEGYFEAILGILDEPKSKFEHYQAIRVLAGVDAIDNWKKGGQEDPTGMMFHLNTDQQQKLCKTVTNYKYRGDKSRTSEWWERFEDSVHDQSWCKKA